MGVGKLLVFGTVHLLDATARDRTDTLQHCMNQMVA
jgi:hypothetical protein